MAQKIVKTVALFGPPGAGKGTYGKLFQRRTGAPIFSVGDFLRNLTKSNPTDPKTAKIKQQMLAGALIDDQTVIEATQAQLKNLSN